MFYMSSDTNYSIVNAAVGLIRSPKKGLMYSIENVTQVEVFNCAQP